jgi:hypothetical protein
MHCITFVHLLLHQVNTRRSYTQHTTAHMYYLLHLFRFTCLLTFFTYYIVFTQLVYVQFVYTHGLLCTNYLTILQNEQQKISYTLLYGGFERVGYGQLRTSVISGY